MTLVNGTPQFLDGRDDGLADRDGRRLQAWQVTRNGGANAHGSAGHQNVADLEADHDGWNVSVLQQVRTRCGTHPVNLGLPTGEGAWCQLGTAISMSHPVGDAENVSVYTYSVIKAPVGCQISNPAQLSPALLSPGPRCTVTKAADEAGWRNDNEPQLHLYKMV